MDKVAVVIPNYNGYRYLETCFAALAKQTFTEFTTYFVDNGSQDDLPVKLDQDGVPLYDETQRISQVDETGTERGIFRSFTTLREVLIHGKLEKAKAEIKAKGADTIPKDKAKDLATVL